jgi:precorrin-6B methylase 2
MIGLKEKHTALDIGCGCGGLGLALSEKFLLTNYVGVDINPEAVNVGKQLNPSASLICGDILDLTNGELSNQLFDTVFSLSCIDYNIRFSEMLDVAWSHVAPGGQFVATFRLCLDEGINDINLSYQHINFENIQEGEIAPYVILNFWKLLQLLEKFSPSEIKVSGYWGPPAGSAVTPYKSVCFAALSISKKLIPDNAKVLYTLDLPSEFILPVSISR